jgi:hypothetical protein
MANEQLKITEAWEYFRNKTGVQIERRAFFAWIEEEGTSINGNFVDLKANQLNTTWWIARHKIDELIATLSA